MSDNSLEIKIKGNDEHYEETLKGVEGKTKKTFSNMEKNQADLVAGADKAAKKLATTATVVGGAVLGVGVAYNSQIEQYKAGFETMLGSAKKADETLGQLKNLASTTPFELTDLANASTTLIAFGENVDDLMPDLKMLGDISLGNKEKFSSLALVFGQVKSQGRLMGQDLLQMINAGFNPLLVISEKTGESMDSLKDKMSKGQITFDMIAEAMKTATSQGGQFYNAMEAQSKTLQGQFSTLKDSVQEFTGEVSEDLSEYLTNDVLPALIEKMETLKEMWEDGSLQKWLGGAAAAATMLGVAIAAIKIGGLISDFKNLVKGVTDFTAATKLGTAAQKALNAAQASSGWGLLLTAIGMVVAATASYIAVAGDAGNETKKLADELKNVREEYDSSIKSIDKATAEQIAETKVVDTLKDKLYSLEEQLNSNTLSENLAKEKREEFNAVANELNNIIPGIIDNIGTETNQFALQRNEIENLITSYKELAIAKAYATAYQNKMTKAAEKEIEAEHTYTKALNEHKRLNKDLWDEGEYEWEKAKQANGGNAPIDPDTGRAFDRGAYIRTWIANNSDVKSNFNVLNQAEKDQKEYAEDSALYAEMYAEQMAKIGDQTEETGKKVGAAFNGTTDNLKANLEEQKNAISKAADDELDILDKAHTLGLISDNEYYYELGQIRNKYFKEGSSEWESYTDKIENYVTSSLKKLKDEMEKLVSDMQGKLDDFSKKLHDDAHKTYSTITLYEGETSKTWTTLANMEYQNNKLEEQLDLIKKVKEKRGNIPEAAMEELRNMGTDEAITFLQTMLKQSDEQWEKWASGIEENKRLADEYAKETYATELDENLELINKFKEQWGELPDEFFEVGQDCAERYGAGLQNALEGILAEARASIMSMFSTPPAGVIMSELSGIGGGSSTTYTDNRTTNIYANGTSARGVIEATKQANIYQNHTSKFGG